MGLGGALIWTGVVNNVKRKYPDSKIYLVYNRGLKLFFSNPDEEIYKSNPDIAGLVPRPSLHYLVLLIKQLFYAKNILVNTNDRNLQYWDNYKNEQMLYKKGVHAIEVGCRPWGITEVELSPRIVLAESEKASVDALLNEKGLSGKSFIVVEPHTKSGNTPNKRWFWERWQELINRLNNYFQEYEKDVVIVQVGVAANPILSGVVDMTGQTSFRGVARILERSQLLVAQEGGLVHLARAVRKKAIVLIPALLPYELMAYPGNINFYTDLDCKWCGLFSPCPKNRKCMDDISVEEVFNAVINQVG